MKEEDIITIKKVITLGCQESYLLFKDQVEKGKNASKSNSTAIGLDHHLCKGLNSIGLPFLTQDSDYNYPHSMRAKKWDLGCKDSPYKIETKIMRRGSKDKVGERSDNFNKNFANMEKYSLGESLLYFQYNYKVSSIYVFNNDCGIFNSETNLEKVDELSRIMRDWGFNVLFCIYDVDNSETSFPFSYNVEDFLNHDMISSIPKI